MVHFIAFARMPKIPESSAAVCVNIQSTPRSSIYCDAASCCVNRRAEVGMTQTCMRAYTQLVIKTCHKRGVHAMGGMAAQIPIKGDPAANKVRFLGFCSFPCSFCRCFAECCSQGLHSAVRGYVLQSGAEFCSQGLRSAVRGCIDPRCPGKPGLSTRLSDDERGSVQPQLNSPRSASWSAGPRVLQTTAAGYECSQTPSGSASFLIPVRSYSHLQAAMEKVRADKLREVMDGHDGTWVAHPALLPIAMDVRNFL
jgi:hypothetical protein